LGEVAGLADRSPRGLVVVSGADAGSFLQSLVSQDLDPVTDGDGVRSLLLAPQGKLDVEFRALRVGDDWWLDGEAADAARLVASLTRFKLRVAATIEDLTAQSGLLTVFGDAGAAHVAAMTAVDVPDRVYAHVAWASCRIVRAAWPGQVAIDIVGPRPALDAARRSLLEAGVPALTSAALEVARIRSGIPRFGVDVDDATIPQEAFLERDAVSFTKGCFLGQELVTRIDTRGHVNRYLRVLDVDGATVPPRGAAVELDGKSVVDPAGVVVALGMVRREVEPPATVVVRWEGGESGATVQGRDDSKR
jgi:folate-binding protein YgfZ